MPKKPKGITPENLAKFLARLKALPVKEPATIPSRTAIANEKAAFRLAMKQGHSIEEIVKLWNEFGPEIKPDTCLGYLRTPANTSNKTQKDKVSGATVASKASDRKDNAGSSTALPSNETQTQVGIDPEPSAVVTQTEPSTAAEKPIDPNLAAENAEVDAFLARQAEINTARTGNG